MTTLRSKASGLPIVNDKAAAIDIGSRFHVVAVPPDLCDKPVQTFQAFTADLQRMADWIVSLGIRTVTMESTGVYWIPAYEILDSRGIEVIVANARESRVASRARAQERCQRCAMASAAARLWLVASERPTERRHCCASSLPAASRAATGLRRSPHPARAEGADLHEPAVAPRRQRHHRAPQA